MVSQIKEESDSLTNSMDDILRELDQEEIHIVISKDIRRFRKIATVVKGLKDKKRDGIANKRNEDNGRNWRYL